MHKRIKYIALGALAILTASGYFFYIQHNESLLLKRAASHIEPVELSIYHAYHPQKGWLYWYIIPLPSTQEDHIYYSSDWQIVKNPKALTFIDVKGDIENLPERLRGIINNIQASQIINIQPLDQPEKIKEQQIKNWLSSVKQYGDPNDRPVIIAPAIEEK